jgi:REP element-mobilizing transposase RayT
VTIVAHRRATLFGAVVGKEMKRSAVGSIADACWREIPAHFPHVELGSFVVMPNHIHGILILRGIISGADAVASAPRRGTIYRAPTEGFGAPRAGSIPTIVRTYKAAVTRAAGRLAGIPRPIWQRNYYEHIIRDETDHDRIRRYILANPMSWDNDEENPARESRPVEGDDGPPSRKEST